MVDQLVDLVQTEWNEGDNDVDDDRLLIEKSDVLGKGRDLGTYDYIEFSTTSPFGIEYADLFMSSQDINTVVFVEIKASTQARRDELFGEFRRIIEAHRKRPDTPGDHDKMVFEDITPLDDMAFGAHLLELVVAFTSNARTVDA